MSEAKHRSHLEVVDRLKKISGHVNGVAKMVELDKPCDEILLQLSAVQAAVVKVGQIILDDHIEECFVDRIDDPEMKESIRLFKAALSRLIR